jgi:trans-2,3-dihydro-3-hydroxyanthranilate isomerase
MTTPVPFYFVDVFASHPLAGNPLSLVTDADGLDESQMRAISREFNQSETTFLLSPSLPGATWRLRSFTPIGAEVGGAGHNALGAWLWLAASGRLPPVSGGPGLAQEIGGEVLPVEVIRAEGRPVAVWLDQSPPEFGESVGNRGELAASLGLTEDDLVAGEPAQVVSTGAAHLMVPVRDRGVVDRAAPDAPRLAAALRQVGGEGCYLYSPDPVDAAGAVAYTRFFNPTVGISEDPATGTAAGPLVALLVAAGTVPQDSTAIVEQGYALGRPSRSAAAGDSSSRCRTTTCLQGWVMFRPRKPIRRASASSEPASAARTPSSSMAISW